PRPRISSPAGRHARPPGRHRCARPGLPVRPGTYRLVSHPDRGPVLSHYGRRRPARRRAAGRPLDNWRFRLLLLPVLLPDLVLHLLPDLVADELVLGLRFLLVSVLGDVRLVRLLGVCAVGRRLWAGADLICAPFTQTGPALSS